MTKALNKTPTAQYYIWIHAESKIPGTPFLNLLQVVTIVADTVVDLRGLVNISVSLKRNSFRRNRL